MSDEELDPKELLLKMQRKEKKDLQSKIQVLKKTASKGDKKKKKEAAEEIANLEAELTLKHKNELAQFDELNDKNHSEEETPSPEEIFEANEEQNDQEENFNNFGNQRISKAQKRRDKKAAKEQERLKEIEKQEEENKYGNRNREAEKIKSILNSRNLVIKEIPSNGDCMFAGLAYQLGRLDINTSVKQLRKAAAEHIRANSDDYLPFLSDSTTGEMLNEEQFDKYCQDMENVPVWGGQVELRALSETLKRPIEVVQAEGPSVIVGEEFKKSDDGQSDVILTYHRHAYGLGEHYNAAVKKS